MMHQFRSWLTAFICLSLPSVGWSAESTGDYTVKSEGLTVILSRDGRILHAKLAGKPFAITGGTALVGFAPQGATDAQAANGAWSFTRTLVEGYKNTAKVTDRFSPTKDSIRWEVEITSSNAPWFTTNETRFNHPIQDPRQNLDLGDGLMAKGDKLTGFTLAGKDGKFVFASAIIDGSTVAVTSGKINKTTTVRYDWAMVPDGNLFNREGLPVAFFRIDEAKDLILSVESN